VYPLRTKNQSEHSSYAQVNQSSNTEFKDGFWGPIGETFVLVLVKIVDRDYNRFQALFPSRKDTQNLLHSLDSNKYLRRIHNHDFMGDL